MPDFVVVGSDGTEHHFPDGMDLKTAIQIVKDSELKTAGSPSEPSTSEPIRGGLSHPLTSLFAPEIQKVRDYLMSLTGTTPGTPVMARSRTGALYPSEVPQGGMEDIAKHAARGAGGELLNQAEAVTSPVGATAAAIPMFRGGILKLLSKARGPVQALGETLDSVPSQSIYAPVKLAGKTLKGVSRVLPTEAETLGVDRFKPNVSGVPVAPNDGTATIRVPYGRPQGEIPESVPPAVETAQDSLARRTVAPTGGTATERVPYGSLPPTPQGQTIDEVLWEALNKHLAESRTGAQQTTLPSQVSVGGTQKPRLGRRPGGYTTDLPPTVKGELKDVGGELSPNAQHGPAIEGQPSEAPVMGGESPTITPGETSPTLHHGQFEQPFTEDIVGEGKPKLSTTEGLQMLRRMFGSRDASRMMYGSGGDTLSRAEAIDAVKRLAPGPSQTPLAAEARINAATQAAKGDDLSALLMKMLTERGPQP